ncbi:MAG: anhydro-N-acetylmuramic acid kinase [Bacteroidales bacterium]|nr:anhydro-N-acetylmuramic acid kinase [Bacteroidales bacterium]
MIYNVLGLMSGTSLDGLDLALCKFDSKDFKNFSVIKTITAEFPEDLSSQVKNALMLSAIEFVELHKNFGEFIAAQINKFLSTYKIDFVASHGHTVVHFPFKNVNFQIGDGATISSLTGLPVVCDFRSNDIALGGQGAPLVPAGEKYLFSDYDTFLNIGGFSNVSFWREKILAYDITPTNYALNYFANLLNQKFDKNGNFGRKGDINFELLSKLSQLTYYKKTPPKSLADHWFFSDFLPEVEKFKIPIHDKMRTIYELSAVKIGENLDQFNTKKVLVTGGGAHNLFLIELLKKNTRAKIIIPSKQIVDYKEAIIFAFLGLLRWLKIPNCLSSVTGAKFDNIGGAIYQTKQLFK